MWIDGKRLAEDVRRWRDAGWVTVDGYAEISREIDGRRHGVSLASVLGILASILLGFALMSFVAAHWQDMSRWSRLAMLFGLVLAGYGAAGLFASRDKPYFADAAILFSIAAFGASVMLISQMFHIDGHPPDGVLLWWLGALLAGAVLRSNPALAAAMVLVAVWTGMSTGETGNVHWPFLGAWFVISAAFASQRWAPGTHLSGLAMTGFLISLGYLLNRGNWHAGVAIIGVAGVVAAIAVSRFRPVWDAVAAPALGYAIAATTAAMIALQFFEKTTTAELIVYAALTLLGLLAVIGYGLANNHRGAIWLGYIGFSIEVLALYGKTINTILDTSLFFLVAGALVAGLAFMAWRLAHRLDGQRASDLRGRT